MEVSTLHMSIMRMWILYAKVELHLMKLKREGCTICVWDGWHSRSRKQWN